LRPMEDRSGPDYGRYVDFDDSAGNQLCRTTYEKVCRYWYYHELWQARRASTLFRFAKDVGMKAAIRDSSLVTTIRLSGIGFQRRIMIVVVVMGLGVCRIVDDRTVVVLVNVHAAHPSQHEQCQTAHKALTAESEHGHGQEAYKSAHGVKPGNHETGCPQ
jgi:hypothetical protein